MPEDCQSRRRLQRVMPDPQPISCGNFSQGMPLRRTNRIPVRQARSGTRVRPPFGLRGTDRSMGGIRHHKHREAEEFSWSTMVALGEQGVRERLIAVNRSRVLLEPLRRTLRPVVGFSLEATLDAGIHKFYIGCLGPLTGHKSQSRSSLKAG